MAIRPIKDRRRDRQLGRIERRQDRRFADTDIVRSAPEGTKGLLGLLGSVPEQGKSYRDVIGEKLVPYAAGDYNPYYDRIRIAESYANDPSVLIHEKYHDAQTSDLGARALQFLSNRAQDPAVRKAFRKAKRAYKGSDYQYGSENLRDRLAALSENPDADYSMVDLGRQRTAGLDPYVYGVGKENRGYRGGQHEFEAILKGSIDYAKDNYGVDLASDSIEEAISKLDKIKGQNPSLLQGLLIGAKERADQTGDTKEVDALMGALNTRYGRTVKG